MLQKLDRELYNDRLAYLVVLAITGIVFLVEFHEVFETNPIYNGYLFVKQTIEPACSWVSLPFERGGLNWYLVCGSYMTFGNSQVVPFLISVSLIPVSFLFSRKYTNNFVGVCTSIGLTLNPVFLIFDSSAAYAQTWALLFMLSLYWYKKNEYVSAGFFIASTFAKAIPLAWVPFLLYEIIKNKRCHYFLIFVFLAIITFGIIMYLDQGGSVLYSNFIRFPTTHQITNLLVNIYNTWRWNELLLFAHIPMIILYIIKRKVWRLSMTPPLLTFAAWGSLFVILLFTNEIEFPYRIIPNIIMFLFASSSLLYGFLAKNVFKHEIIFKT